MLFPILEAQWEDVSLDFFFEFPWIQCQKDSVMEVVDIFTKMIHFNLCQKTNGVVQVVDLYFKEIGRDVNKHIHICWVCHLAKAKSQNIGLYMSFPILEAPWEYVGMDFSVYCLELNVRKILWQKLWTCFPKWLLCQKTNGVVQVVNLYLKEIVRLYIIPKTITYV